MMMMHCHEPMVPFQLVDIEEVPSKDHIEENTRSFLEAFQTVSTV